MQNRVSDRTHDGLPAFDASADISSINDNRFNGQKVDTFKTPGRLNRKGLQTSLSGISSRKDKSPFMPGLAGFHQAPSEAKKSETVVMDTGHEEMTRRIFNEQWQQFAEKQQTYHEQMQRRIVGTIRDDVKHVLANFQNSLRADVQNGMDRCSTTVLETRELQSRFREAIQELQQTNCLPLTKTENISQKEQAQVSYHCERLGDIVKDMVGVQQSLAAAARNLSLETIMPDILLQIRGAAIEIETRLEDSLHNNISQIQKQIAEQQIPSKLVDDIEHIKGVMTENFRTSEHGRNSEHVFEAITEIKEQIRDSLRTAHELPNGMRSQQNDVSIQEHDVKEYVLHLSTRALQTKDAGAKDALVRADDSHRDTTAALVEARTAISGDISTAVMPVMQEIKDEIDRRFSTQHAVLESIKARIAPLEIDLFQPLLDSADQIKLKLEDLSKHQQREQVEELLTNVHRITATLDEQSPALQHNLQLQQVLQSDVGYIKHQAEQHFEHSLFEKLRALPESLWERYRSDQTLSDELQSFRRREIEDLKGRMESAETCIINDLRREFSSLHEVCVSCVNQVDLRNEVDLLVHEIKAATTPVLYDATPEVVAKRLQREPEDIWFTNRFPTEVALVAFALVELVIQVSGAYLELDDGNDQSRFLAAWTVINLPWFLNAISCFAFFNIEWQGISDWADENVLHSRIIGALAVLRPSFLRLFSLHIPDLQGAQSSVDRRALEKAIQRETAELRQERDDLKRAILEQQDMDAASARFNDAAAPERPQKRIEQEVGHQMCPPGPCSPGAPSHDPAALHLTSHGQGAAPLSQELQIQASHDGETAQSSVQPQLPGTSIVTPGDAQHFQGVIPMDNLGSVSQQQQADRAGGPGELDNWQAVLVNRALGDGVKGGAGAGGQLPSCLLCGFAPQAMDAKAVRQYRMLQHGSALAALLYSDLPKIMVALWLLGVFRFDCTHTSEPSTAAAVCAHILVVLCSSLNIVYVLMHLLCDFLPYARSDCRPSSAGLHFFQLTEGAFDPQLETSDHSVTIQINVEETNQPVSPDEFFCELKSVKGDNSLHLIQRIAVPALAGNPRCVLDGLPENTDFVVSLAPAKDGILLCHPKQYPITTGRSAELRPDLELRVADVGPTWAILAWKNVDLEANIRVSIFSPAGSVIRTELTRGTCHTLHGLESSTSYFVEAGFLDLRQGEQACTVQFDTAPSGGPAAIALQDQQSVGEERSLSLS